MTSLSFVNATIEGVVRSPSLFSITRGLPPSMMATHEFVVPRSMPIVLAIGLLRNALSCASCSMKLGCVSWMGSNGRDSSPARDDDARRPQEPPVDLVAPLH